MVSRGGTVGAGCSPRGARAFDPVWVGGVWVDSGDEVAGIPLPLGVDPASVALRLEVLRDGLCADVIMDVNSWLLTCVILKTQSVQRRWL